MTIEITLSKDAFGELLAENPKLAEEYTDDPKSEDNYILSGVAGWESPDDVTGLKSALGKERENVTAERQEKAKLKESLEQLTAAAESAQQTGDADLKAQLTALQADFATLSTTLASERSQRAILEAVAANKGIPIALSEFLHRRIKTNPGTGRPYAVNPDTGEALLDSDGKPMTVGAYTKHLRQLATSGKQPELGALFLGAQSSGGGTPPGSGGNGGKLPTNLRRGTMTPRQKVDFIKQQGDAAYQRLPL